MPRPANIYNDYHGRRMSLPEVAPETGLGYITLVRRWQAGDRDLTTLLRPSRRREICTARHASECYECPHADCIRPVSSRLTGEDYPYYW